MIVKIIATFLIIVGFMKISNKDAFESKMNYAKNKFSMIPEEFIRKIGNVTNITVCLIYLLSGIYLWTI